MKEIADIYFLQHRIERISVIIADISFILKFYFTSKGYSVKNLIPLRRVNSHMVKIILSSVLRKQSHFNSSPTIFFKGIPKVFARACGVPVGRRSGSQLATMLVATKNNIIFYSFPVVYFSQRRSTRIKNLFREG